MITFGEYIVEKEDNYIHNHILNSITYEKYIEILYTEDDNKLNEICSNICDSAENYLKESVTSDKAKKMGLTSMGFGRWGKDGKVLYVSKNNDLIKASGKEKKVDKDNVKQDSDNKASVKNIFKNMKSDIADIGKSLGASKEDITKAFAQKNVHGFMKGIGYSLKSGAKASNKFLSLFDKGLKNTFTELGKTKGFKKLEKGGEHVDEFLKKHPKMKKIAGVALAGFLVYQWQNMAFSGDFDSDFDVEDIGNAMSGDFSFKDLVTSPSGVKGLTQLGIGLATGVTFPWKAVSKASLGMAAAYTGLKKLGKTDLAKKTKQKIKDKGKKALEYFQKKKS